MLFIPIAYAFALYANYEMVFVRLRMGAEKDRSVMVYAKRKVLCYAQLRLSRVVKLTHARGLVFIQSKEDVDEFLRSLR